MSNAIRESITETFGFEPICINSALVSAQNRQRLYWVGKRNDDGTYSKVNVEQPEDKGILLKDILNSGDDLTTNNKAWTLTASYNGAVAWNTIERCQRNMVIEPVGVTKDNKSYCLTSGYSNGSGENIGNYAAHTLEKGCKSMVAEPVNITNDGKSQTIKTQYQQSSIANFCKYTSTYGATGVAEPVSIRCRGREDIGGKWEARIDGKNGVVTANTVGINIAEPVAVNLQVIGRKKNDNGEYERSWEARKDGKASTITSVDSRRMVAEPIRVGALPRPNGELSASQAMRVYSTEGKSVNLVSGGGGMGGKTGLYAIPVEVEDDKPIKATSCADGKTYTVYEVKGGLITIKGKEYPIKLIDGYYIIRKLTVSECKRLQTVPEWYEFPVSDSQAYKMLGNGWTVDVIAHLIKATL